MNHQANGHHLRSRIQDRPRQNRLPFPLIGIMVHVTPNHPHQMVRSVFKLNNQNAGRHLSMAHFLPLSILCGTGSCKRGYPVSQAFVSMP